MNQPLSRATDVAGIRERMSRFRSDAGTAYAAAFRPRPDDVIIATYPKSGTTWMQQIVHALRSGGDMQFREITEVVPWIEMAHDLGIDLDAPQRGPVRAFKSHARGDDVPTGARYICIVRAPEAVLRSFFRFFEGWVFETGSISLDTFANDFFLDGSESGDYWTHLLSWWQRDPTSPVLLLAYEEMLSDLPATVEWVADFIGIQSEDARAIAVERSSFDTMSAHRTKFDDHLVRALRDPVCGLPPGGSSDKVAVGRAAGSDFGLSETVQRALSERWANTIRPALGFADYAELLAAIPGERERRRCR